MLSSLTGNKATALAHSEATAITTNLGNSTDLQSFFTTQAGSGNASAPKAYLNYVFLDEQFNFVGQSSGAQKVSQPGNGATPLQAANLVVPKNGYVYVYLSNESIEPVYFDNFTVSHQRSPLIEENHYYAYGLKIQAISSKAVASTLNPTAVSHGYQGSYAEEVSEFDLGYEEFDLRTYDPQLGRWTGVDPFDEFASPYVGMGGDPANNVDPSGGFLGGGLTGALGGAAIGGIIGGISDMITGRTDGGGFLMGMAIGSGGGALFSPGVSTLNSGESVAGSQQAVVGGVGQAANEPTTGNAAQIAGNAHGPNGSELQMSEPDQTREFWILYSGKTVTIYEGEYGETGKVFRTYKGTSGIITYSDKEATKILDDYRNSKYQFKKDKLTENGREVLSFVGPLPEGEYTIDLSYDPNRQALLGKDHSTIPGKGIEKLTYYKDGKEYIRFGAWGSQRARLEAAPGTKLGGRDGNFYFHDSSKGFTHGCIETEVQFFADLKGVIRQYMCSIKVQIKYDSKNSSTDGNTRKE